MLGLVVVVYWGVVGVELEGTVVVSLATCRFFVEQVDGAGLVAVETVVMPASVPLPCLAVVAVAYGEGG